MPFSGPSSYLPTIDEFIGHWTDVDAALSAGGPLELQPDAYNLVKLQADRDALATEITEIEGTINVLEGHRTGRDNEKEAMKERLRQLGGFVKSQLRDSVYAGEVPALIGLTDSMGKWIIAMDDASHMWTAINATPPAGFAPPLLLVDGYTLATFNTDIAALKTRFTNYTQAAQDVERSIDERDSKYREIRDRLVQYRAVVPSLFAEDHPLVLSLPRLTPLPGHTPDPVVLSGVWNAGTTMGDLSWTPSSDVDLDHYEVRRSGSDPYNGNTEVMVASVLSTQTTLSTVEGLPSSGATMRYKVYVVLTTGNEAGSNAVEITRP
jgi:hypothetical protein